MISWPTKLKENEVFVFGSNSAGFHGAGAAGYAFRGTAENTWRKDEKFKKAMRGDRDYIVGKWAIFGYSHGFQQGASGKSYAICTIKRPGQPRSVPLSEIESQLNKLFQFAIDNSDLVFYVTPIGEGFAGYTQEEMREVWRRVISKNGHPNNIHLLLEKSLWECMQN